MLTLSQPPGDPAFLRSPWTFYDRLRAAGSVALWQEFGLPVSARAATVGVILRDRRLGRAPPGGMAPPVPDHLTAFHAVEDHSMLELEPPAHTRIRGLVNRAFTSARVAALAPFIAGRAAALAAALPEGPVDLLPAFAERLPIAVIARLLGIPEAEGPQLLRWSHAMVGMYQARRDHAVELAADRAAADFAAFLRDLLAQRRRGSGQDDLLSALLAATEDGAARLSEAEIVSTVILLLNAGHEATAHAIGLAVAHLIDRPDRAALLAPGQVAATVEELLRLDPPLHLFWRWVHDEIEIGGHLFRRGDRVGALLAAANRDPQAWDRPARLDPGRVARPHHAFGAGLHFCVGAPLARLELQIALPALFAARPGLRLAGRPQLADLYPFRGYRRLMVAG